MHAHEHVDALSDLVHRSPRLGHDCVRTPSSDMLFSTSAARNCGPIAKVISEFFDRSFTGSLLELASGTGQHIVHFASTWPHARCLQPSELNADSLKSIECYTKGLAERENIRNIRSPLVIDVAAPFSQWGLPSESFDIVFVGNLLHISPPAATRSVLSGAANALKLAGMLFLYGPFKVNGSFGAPSNEAFDRSLKARCADWGLRELSDVIEVAAAQRLDLVFTREMPANNHMAAFRKAFESPPAAPRDAH